MTAQKKNEPAPPLDKVQLTDAELEAVTGGVVARKAGEKPLEF
jgi:hypothetical protein